MPKYRKKPVVIEARQWDGTLKVASDIDAWSAGKTQCMGLAQTPHHISIETLEGTMIACPGDWIIKGVKGEFYPCKDDIFAATYEAVEDGQ